jgi:hypothetical protein
MEEITYLDIKNLSSSLNSINKLQNQNPSSEINYHLSTQEILPTMKHKGSQQPATG